MLKYILPLILNGLVLVACISSQAPPELSAQPSAQPTVSPLTSPGSTTSPTFQQPTSPPKSITPTATLTSVPLPTATLQATPNSPLPIGQLMLAYQATGSSDAQLVFLDLTSGSSWEFSFPVGSIFATPFLDGLSPDGRYFVYYQGGKVGDYDILEVDSQEFELHIYDLEQRQDVFSMRLMAPTYPGDMKPLVEMTMDDNWMVTDDRAEQLDEMFYNTQVTLLSTIRTVSWSPDGNLLAFASQSPGPSSDMFYFGPFSGQAWRVTSEINHVYDVTWAPDSSKLALETSLYIHQATPILTYILTRDAAPLTSIEYTYFHSWFNPYTILVHKSIDFGDPNFDLVLISVENNAPTMLWEGSFDKFAIAPDLSSLLVTNSQPNNPGETPGLKLKLLDTGTTRRLSDSVFWNVAYWGSEAFTYAASAPAYGMYDSPQTGGTYGVTQTGKLVLLDESRYALLPSPDGRFLAAYSAYAETTGLRIFGGDGTLIASPSDAHVTCVAWSPTSASLGYQVDQNLFLWQVGEQSARQVAGKLEAEPDGGCGFTWVGLAP